MRFLLLARKDSFGFYMDGHTTAAFTALLETTVWVTNDFRNWSVEEVNKK